MASTPADLPNSGSSEPSAVSVSAAAAAARDGEIGSAGSTKACEDGGGGGVGAGGTEEAAGEQREANAVRGGGGGKKADADGTEGGEARTGHADNTSEQRDAELARGRDVRNLVQVLALWLSAYMPRVQRTIAECVVGAIGARAAAATAGAPGDPAKGGSIDVAIENIGSGALLIPSLRVLPTHTVVDIKRLIAARRPSITTKFQRLFLGHNYSEAAELKDEAETAEQRGLKDGDVLVLAPAIADRVALNIFHAQLWRAGHKGTLPVLRNWGSLKHLRTWKGVAAVSNRVVLLKLQNTGLAGTIPPIIGWLQNMRELDLSFNELTGPIPTEIGLLTGLRGMQNGTRFGLDLSHNRLTGPVPFAELEQMTHLKSANLEYNRFTLDRDPASSDQAAVAKLRSKLLSAMSFLV